MLKGGLAVLAALAIATPGVVSARAPQRIAAPIRVPGKIVTPLVLPATINPGPRPQPLATRELVQVFVQLAEATTPANPQTKIVFTPMHMGGPGYAQLRNVDILGGGSPQSPADGVVLLMTGKKAEAWFFVPNATKPYLMDCSMSFGFAAGSPTRLDYAVATSAETAPISNGHVLFVVPPTAGANGFTPVKVWSGADATWFLFGCEATLMG